jgi:hypothetical protein
MKLSKLAFSQLTLLFLLVLGINHAWAQAPNSLVGKRIQITFDGESTPLGFLYITSNDEEWWWDGENANGDGGWQRAHYQMNKTNSSTINYKGGDLNFGYGEVNFFFSTSSSGTFQFIGNWELKDGNWELDTDDQSTGTFQLETYLDTDFPFEEYFSDDFSDISKSNSIWHRVHGFSMDGVVLSQYNGTLTLSGQYTGDPDDRWFQPKPRSLLPTNKDWTVSGGTFNTSTSDYAKRSTSLIAIHSAVDPSFVLAIGNHVQSSNWHWWYERGWQSSGNSVNQNTSGEFRIYNDSTNKNFVVEWKDAGSWTKALTFNWDTGSYSGTDGSTGQVNDWISLEDEYIQPMIEFGELMNEGEEGSLTFGIIPENSLGASSFSVSEGMPLFSDIAPTSLNGVKITSSLTIDGVGTETRIGWIDTEGTYWEKNDNGNGQWYPAEVLYTKTGNNQAENFIGTKNNSYRDGVITFDSPSSGTYTFEYWDSEGTNPLVKIAEGYGDFTTEPINDEDLPFDRYFWDDFSSSSTSEINWPIHTHNGITNHLHENRFSLSGTISDPEHQYHDVNAHSILSIQNDWVIYGTPIANFSVDGSPSFQSAVGVDFEIKDGSEEFELSIGLSEEGIFSEINTSARPGKNREMQKNSGSAIGVSKFRIINSASEKKISSQYLLDGHWQNVHQLNWETGEYSETDILSGQTTNSQVANWVTYQEAYGSPMMDFQLPSIRNSNGEASFLPLQSGDLGFEEFGVSEGLSLIPTTFENLKLTVHWETESGESGTNLNYVIDEDTVKIHHLYGTSDAFWAKESFTWEESGHNTMSSTTTNADGRVVTGTLIFQDADSGTFELRFYEPENGQLVYQESGSGTFTIEEYSPTELPSTKGWMWFDHYPWVYSHVEGGWLYFHASGSKLMVYSQNDQVWREMQ